jgi:hypothetical protein
MSAGFPEEALVFYEGLEADNTKAYWTDHKACTSGPVRGPLDALLAELAPEFGTAKVFRPYRDVRFSKDKTPYKTHAAAVVEGDGSLYVQLGADGLYVGGGYWHTETDQVQRLRAAVDDDRSGRRCRRCSTGWPGGRSWASGSSACRSRTPPTTRARTCSCTRRWPRGCASSRPSGCTRRSAATRRRAWRQVQPLNAWLAQHVGPTRQERPARR